VSAKQKNATTAKEEEEEGDQETPFRPAESTAPG
jgi:hypothetical protein